MNQTRCEENIIHPDRVKAGQDTLLDGFTATRLADTFQALADPTRLRLISALLETELCVCDLAAVLGMTQSAVSHQLRLLRSLHIVRHRKEGRIVYYTLDDAHVRDLLQRGLEHISHTEEEA
ncbi:MAG TPA: metalloregulator ArsR/SmtB family transcription factor [Anaerolineaceae bacterium]|nr:metalloregulator ArsR/SmtB family transcription factor [Anaerolineaceae bacterium]HPN53912.1 metalloregulator ArsR/SmtB family transcription factor [Anaerolineaceae bacterium]